MIPYLYIQYALLNQRLGLYFWEIVCYFLDNFVPTVLSFGNTFSQMLDLLDTSFKFIIFFYFTLIFNFQKHLLFSNFSFHLFLFLSFLPPFLIEFQCYFVGVKSYLKNINLLFEIFFYCLHYLFPLSSFFPLLAYLFWSLSLLLESFLKDVGILGLFRFFK